MYSIYQQYLKAHYTGTVSRREFQKLLEEKGFDEIKINTLLDQLNFDARHIQSINKALKSVRKTILIYLILFVFICTLILINTHFNFIEISSRQMGAQFLIAAIPIGISLNSFGKRRKSLKSSQRIDAKWKAMESIN